MGWGVEKVDWGEGVGWGCAVRLALARVGRRRGVGQARWGCAVACGAVYRR